jgi:catechol 2,3-dioxygenase-like lactoylglutathione lyase family enzyme
MSPIVTADAAAHVRSIVAMIRVANVIKSAEFYRHFGFEIGNAVPTEGPPFHWAWLYQPGAHNWKTGANLMLVAGEAPESAETKARIILFYLYVPDLRSLREQLASKGIETGEIRYPDYLPRGEFRLQDPDGYTLMIAQSGPDTP